MKHPHPRLARLRAAVHSRAARTVLATGVLALAIYGFTGHSVIL